MFDYRLQLESRAIFRLPALQAGLLGDNAQPGRGRESSEAEWISDYAGETGRFPSAHSADPFSRQDVTFGLRADSILLVADDHGRFESNRVADPKAFQPATFCQRVDRRGTH